MDVSGTTPRIHGRFEVVYDPTQPIKMSLPVFDINGLATGEVVTIDHPGERPVQGRKALPVCAICDDVGKWPRFSHVLGDAD